MGKNLDLPPAVIDWESRFPGFLRPKNADKERTASFIGVGGRMRGGLIGAVNLHRDIREF